MSVIARILAGARDLSFGGPLGTLLGRISRHLPQRIAPAADSPKSDPKKRVAFTIACIALGAKMAKADGTVTPRRGRRVSARCSRCRPARRRMSGWCSTSPASSTAGFDSYARQVGRLVCRRTRRARGSARRAFPHRVGGRARVPGRGCLSARGRAAFRFRCARLCPAPGALCRRSTRIRRRRPAAVLGVAEDASAEEIRAAYRRLVRENHPDLVASRGLPPECVALATARVARINAAHDRLVKRGSPGGAHAGMTHRA